VRASTEDQMREPPVTLVRDFPDPVT
jgi:hypothetical protein